jgi:maleylacetate reductase
MSVGGGSTTGTAKAIALETGLPIIAVPTTYAGSEVTPVWGLTTDGRKTTGTDRRVLPALVVHDPGQPGEPAAAAISRFARRLGAPTSLAELGLREDQLEHAIELVDETLSKLPDPISRADTDALLRAAFQGAPAMGQLSVR